MKLPGLLSFAALVLGINAQPARETFEIPSRDYPLEVSLEHLGSTQFKASLRNGGEESLIPAWAQSLLDDGPVNKVHVRRVDTGEPAPFTGVVLTLVTENLSPEDFASFAPGQMLETELDIAELYDLAGTEAWTVQAVGSFEYAAAGETTLAEDRIPYQSELIPVEIDTAEAASIQDEIQAEREAAIDEYRRVVSIDTEQSGRDTHDDSINSDFEEGEIEARNASLVRRTTLVPNGCTQAQFNTVGRAIGNCRAYSNLAADAALRGSPFQFFHYWATDAPNIRRFVHDRCRRIAQDCSPQDGPWSRMYCNDIPGWNVCAENPRAAAYHVLGSNNIGFCPQWYSNCSEVTTSGPSRHDRASMVVHEVTHVAAVMNAVGGGTRDDFDGRFVYGYPQLLSLAPGQNIHHADTYACYPIAVNIGYRA